MNSFPFTVTELLAAANVAMASIMVILAFSLLGYTFTYNFRSQVARMYAILLACVMAAYSSDVALSRVLNVDSTAAWLRFQWLSIAMVPAGYYLFSLAVLRTTNYRISVRRWVAAGVLLLSMISAASALFGKQLVGDVIYSPPISYLEAGPFFWLFVAFFTVTAVLSFRNIWKARQRCITAASRRRMTYILIGFVGPGMGVFPYLITLSRFRMGVHSSVGVLVLSLLVNMAVAALLVLMSYTVTYFGVLTPDRVVRYRLIRFFMRGPIVAILVILAIQIVPAVERLLGLPRDIALFSVITFVIIASQLALSITKGLIDRLVYREDRDEIAWLRELDRRLLTTSDVRQFLENSLGSLCELLHVPSGFVAAVIGPDLILEAVVGAEETRDDVKSITGWTNALTAAMRRHEPLVPLYHAGYWVWPLLEPVSFGEEGRLLGMLAVTARTETPLLSQDEADALDKTIDRIARALSDRRLQQGVFVQLRTIIPDIDRIQQLRGVTPYIAVESDSAPVDVLLNPSPIHSPEFEAWVKDALSHYWGGPKLTRSPLIKLRIVTDTLDHAEGDPTKALRLVLGDAIERLKPEGRPNLSAPEWLLYNILEMRFIQGRKVREIADRLAMSESDLYRKQRVAIGQVARVLSEMEQDNGALSGEDVRQVRAALDAMASADERSVSPSVTPSKAVPSSTVTSKQSS
jgi:hypothetical protein